MRGSWHGKIPRRAARLQQLIEGVERPRPIADATEPIRASMEAIKGRQATGESVAVIRHELADVRAVPVDARETVAERIGARIGAATGIVGGIAGDGRGGLGPGARDA